MPTVSASDPAAVAGAIRRQGDDLVAALRAGRPTAELTAAADRMAADTRAALLALARAELSAVFAAAGYVGRGLGKAEMAGRLASGPGERLGAVLRARL